MGRIFGGMLAGILIGALLRAAPAPAKPQPPIAPGTTVETVLRTHGRPKGQMHAGTRELWLYDRFRVVFEHGRVVSVDSLDRNTGTEAGSKAAPSTAPARGGQPVSFNITTESPEAPRVAAPVVHAAPVDRVTRTPAQRAAATGRTLLSKIMLGVLFVALGVAVGVVLWANAKQKAAERAGRVGSRPAT
jgi:hypothetical protein